MMSMRSLVLTIIGLIIMASVASAYIVSLDADPDEVLVYPGGYNYTVVNVTVDSSGLYYIQFQVDDVDQSYIDANLSGPYLDPDLTQKATDFDWTGFGDAGSLTWIALIAGSYYFKLNVTATPDAQVGVGYKVDVSGVPGADILIKSDVVNVYPIPELTTFALSAIGLIAIGLIVMRRR